MLVILNLPLVGLWVKLLKIPYRVLFPAILLFCCIGVYADAASRPSTSSSRRASASPATSSASSNASRRR